MLKPSLHMVYVIECVMVMVRYRPYDANFPRTHG